MTIFFNNFFWILQRNPPAVVFYIIFISILIYLTCATAGFLKTKIFQFFKIYILQ